MPSRKTQSERTPATRKKAKATKLFQFKITLRGSKPPIWRRIQVEDCTLDKLHEYIQAAMGWSNSHLHEFVIDGELFGNPEFVDDGFDDFEGNDSTRAKLSRIMPSAGGKFRFQYDYDFGDGWTHDILFEGSPPADPDRTYPVCLEGARACPPEDVGGLGGYADFLESIRDKQHPEHEEMLEWVGGRFDPEQFDPIAATASMMTGMPNWRD